MIRPDDTTDAWFYDLGELARRLTTTARRQWVVVIFVLFAFLVLAWRSEINSDRIGQAQLESCLRGVVILERFNAQQSSLAALERAEGDMRAAEVYEGFRIDPLPNCGGRA